ncbi:reverse transcriptase domain-containing protein, partial [Tanacetum coccineum]
CSQSGSTYLLEKETPFIFSKECIEAFETLKMKLTQAPILVAPDWDLPFEIMCDASDFAVGAVLGQRMSSQQKRKFFKDVKHYCDNAPPSLLRANCDNAPPSLFQRPLIFPPLPGLPYFFLVPVLFSFCIFSAMSGKSW